MPMLEGKVDAVIGVDTHRDAHAAAILDRNGGLVAQLEVPSSQAGAQSPARRGRRASTWAALLGAGGDAAATALGWPASWPTRASGSWRSTGPSGPGAGTAPRATPLDAVRAGREALSREHLACPRQRGHREALRVLQLTRSGAVKVAADARRQLKALLVTAPEPLRAAAGWWDLAYGRPALVPSSKPKPGRRWRTGRPCRRCG